MRRFLALATMLPLALSVLALTSCEQAKSATPLSPSLAGPIAGVQISQPAAVQPAESSQVSADLQPVTLVVTNAATSGVRPVSYLFELATDYGFTKKVFTQNGVPAGDGKTSVRLPVTLASGQVYYWRVKAYDGANEGDYSPPVNFTVFTPVVIGVPGLLNPAQDSTTTTTKPILEVLNAPVTGPAGPIHYLFDVATDSAMANRIISADVVGGGSGRTAYGIPNDLAVSTRYFWRVRAFDASHVGNYTSVASFLTPATAVPPNGGGGDTGGTPTTAPGDQIDMRSVTIALGADIRGWAVTSTITSATHIGDTLCTNHTKAGLWPVVQFFDTGATVEGNQWFFANINGKWVAGANEWLRPGQTCKGISGNIGADNFPNTALQNWSPSPGETLGVAVSTPARAGQQGIAERSNVVLIRW